MVVRSHQNYCVQFWTVQLKIQWHRRQSRGDSMCSCWDERVGSLGFNLWSVFWAFGHLADNFYWSFCWKLESINTWVTSFSSKTATAFIDFFFYTAKSANVIFNLLLEILWANTFWRYDLTTVEKVTLSILLTYSGELWTNRGLSRRLPVISLRHLDAHLIKPEETSFSVTKKAAHIYSNIFTHYDRILFLENVHVEDEQEQCVGEGHGQVVAEERVGGGENGHQSGSWVRGESAECFQLCSAPPSNPRMLQPEEGGARWQWKCPRTLLAEDDCSTANPSRHYPTRLFVCTECS